ncbi:MAG TPA: putative baseplate assembly protein, partial [Thermoanaerobaculia bacterium]|nr:putative baseplate assembly protein [Thermoanaerobaculia bacterium]
LNGIDYVDVSGAHLCVHFLDGIPEVFLPTQEGEELTPEQKSAAIAHISVRGGRRVRDLKVVDFRVDPAANKFEEECLGIELDREGDWSEYTLCFIEQDGTPMRGFDPRYACTTFSFKIDCPAEIDCKESEPCPDGAAPPPAISYLAKDYATFRRLILDRLSLTMPEWRERHVPDLGIALVELLAYVGDYLSAAQDAAGTEQYLDTARMRISVRRHARLVDYLMHEGCNARAFVHLRVTADAELDPRTFFFATRSLDDSPVALRDEDLARLAPRGTIFEPIAGGTVRLFSAHNRIVIYTWGDRECCLPKGATRATLLDELEEHDERNDAICDEGPHEPPHPGHGPYCNCGYQPPPEPTPRPLRLQAGDYLLFDELACAGTVTSKFDGDTTQPDADRTHRHVVRLTKVEPSCDPLLGNRLLEVEWDREDALPFALCVSAIGGPPDCDYVRDLGVARGNLVLADHGASVFDELLPPVPERPFADVCEGEDDLADVPRLAGRYRPVLRIAPLTVAEPVDTSVPATLVVRQDPRAALPAVAISAIPPSPIGQGLLFDAGDLRDVGLAAEQLIAKTTPARKALRRRLRHDVEALLAAGEITPELVDELLANLRELTERWLARPDLLDSDLDDPHFVAELDDDGFAHLRFGDGDAGRLPDPGSAFVATYRSGNGRAGLIGAEALGHIVWRNGFNEVVARVRNPLAAAGAVDPESAAEVKMLAPKAFRKSLERAVTASDYALLAQYVRQPKRNPRVQSAAASLSWSGSWYEADVAVDAAGSPLLPDDLQQSVTRSLHRYRRMGHDLRVEGADVVPLRLTLDLCVKPGYLRAHVTAAVRAAMRDFFQPDNLTFGGAVYVSRIVEAVMRVDGVAEVHVVRLQRLAHGAVANEDFVEGFLELGPTEVARLDNDPAAPENGLLELRHVRGGR